MACPWRSEDFLLPYRKLLKISEFDFELHYDQWEERLQQWPAELKTLKAQRRKVRNRVYAKRRRDDKQKEEERRNEAVLAAFDQLQRRICELECELKYAKRLLHASVPCPYSHTPENYTF